MMREDEPDRPSVAHSPTVLTGVKGLRFAPVLVGRPAAALDPVCAPQDFATRKAMDISADRDAAVNIWVVAQQRGYRGRSRQVFVGSRRLSQLAPSSPAQYACRILGRHALLNGEALRLRHHRLMFPRWTTPLSSRGVLQQVAVFV